LKVSRCLSLISCSCRPDCCSSPACWEVPHPVVAVCLLRGTASCCSYVLVERCRILICCESICWEGRVITVCVLGGAASLYAVGSSAEEAVSLTCCKEPWPVAVVAPWRLPSHCCVYWEEPWPMTVWVLFLLLTKGAATYLSAVGYFFWGLGS
jgi:hypothetical protein